MIILDVKSPSHRMILILLLLYFLLLFFLLLLQYVNELFNFHYTCYSKSLFFNFRWWADLLVIKKGT